MEAMTQLNYPSPMHIDKGICFGVAHMGKQAMLADDIQTFNDRFDRMYDAIMSNEEIEQLGYETGSNVATFRLKEARLLDKEMSRLYDQGRLRTFAQIDAKLGADKVALLNKKEDDYYELLAQQITIKPDAAFKSDVDLRAFFDGIEIYNFLFMHPELFDKKIPFHRNPELALSLTLPVQLESRKIVCVDSFSGIYNLQELKDYFESLRQTLEAPIPFTHPVSLIMRGFHHTTHVGYCPKQKAWIFIDANTKYEDKQHLPITIIIKTDLEMARTMLNNFWAANERIAFTTEVSVTGDQVNTFKNYLTRWHQTPAMQVMHTVTEFKARFIANIRRRAIETDFWLLPAAQCGHTSTAIALLAAGANPNLISEDGATALYIAVINNHADIVHALLEANANPNMLTKDLATPLYPAVRNGNVDIINLLLPKNININQVRKDGMTILRLAIKNDHSDVIPILLKAGAQLTQQDLDFAKTKGNVSIITLLTEQYALLPKPVEVNKDEASAKNLSQFGLLGISSSKATTTTPLLEPDTSSQDKVATGCCTIM